MIERIPSHIMRIRDIQPNPYVELVTVLIIVGVSFYIFFKTKEIYDLTKHQGINYFRKAFLFFGISSIVGLLMPILRPFRFILPHVRGGFFLAMILMLIAILYAFFSIFWKEFDRERYIYYIAFSVMIVIFFIDIRSIVLIFESLLFLTIGVISYFKYREKTRKKKKSFSSIYLIYIALFCFWLLNAIRIQLAIYFDITGTAISFLSAGIFLYILYIFRKRFSHK